MPHLVRIWRKALPGSAHYPSRWIPPKFAYALLAIAWSNGLCGLKPAWGQPAPAGNGSRMDLAKGWLIQSSAKVTDKGAVVSRSGFQPHAWYPSSIPSTVVAALVNNKVYPDP